MHKLYIYTDPKEIEAFRKAGRLAATVLDEVCKRAKPGVSTAELDAFAEEWIVSRGATPTFKGYLGFPASLCTSLNHEVVHGIPASSCILKDGDILSVDVGVTLLVEINGQAKKFIGDNAKTVPIGSQHNSKTLKLIEDIQLGLMAGIAQCHPNKTVRDIAEAIEAVSRAKNYGSVEEFGGHGIGPEYHCAPFIPNYTGYFKEFPDQKIQEGMILAVEPMFNLGLSAIRKLKDGWTIVTKDGKLSAHYEHSVYVSAEGPEILTVVDPSLV